MVAEDIITSKDNQANIIFDKSMLEAVSKVSPSNQLLFNQISKELCVSLAKPTLEFVDILIESLMYPRGTGRSLMNLMCGTEESLASSEHQFAYENQDLGHGCLLHLVHARQLLVRVQGYPTTGAPEYVSTLLALLEDTHGVLVSLLQQLSRQIEVPACPEIYKQLLRENLEHFRNAFTGFQALDHIMHQLLETVEESGSSSTQVFQIGPKTIERIKSFSAHNSESFERLMLGSRALREYLLLQDYKTDYLDQIFSAKVPKGILSAVHSSDFGIYMQLRKSKLKISHRRVF